MREWMNDCFPNSSGCGSQQLDSSLVWEAEEAIVQQGISLSETLQKAEYYMISFICGI